MRAAKESAGSSSSSHYKGERKERLGRCDHLFQRARSKRHTWRSLLLTKKNEKPHACMRENENYIEGRCDVHVALARCRFISSSFLEGLTLFSVPNSLSRASSLLLISLTNNCTSEFITAVFSLFVSLFFFYSKFAKL